MQALGARAAAHRAFLELLDRRLDALVRLAAGEAVAPADLGTGPTDRRTARRFLRPREASWHDGDENRVRAHLDRWSARDAHPRRAAARAILSAAEDAATGARPETLWFLLWAMESAIPLLTADVPSDD